MGLHSEGFEANSASKVGAVAYVGDGFEGFGGGAGAYGQGGDVDAVGGD